jgi:hypothetical protein
MRIAFAVLLFFSFFAGAHGQSRDFILLKKGANQKSQIRFYPGEEITYKSKKLGYFVTDKIVNLDKDFIYLTENILSPSDIQEVAIRHKDPRNRTLRNLSAIFIGAGTILLVADAANSALQADLSIDEGVAISSGILLGTGLALLPVRYKTFKNTSGYGIQIILMRMD